MPIAILQFDLNNPDEKNHFDIMSKSKTMHEFIWDFCQLMRNMQKYGFEPYLLTAEDMLSELRNKYFEMLDENNLLPLE